MLTVVGPDIEERRKHLAALRRAVPVTRMVDYGVPPGDALAVHEATAAEDPPAWDAACEERALRHIRLAEGSREQRQTASHAWRAASALMQCAQLAFNADVPRKKALYERAHEAMREHAALSDDLAPVDLPTAAGDLQGWVVSPRSMEARAAVIVLGGSSGWGAAYLDMGRALAARGMLSILAEGPGQGRSRMQGGIHLDVAALPLFGRFLDHAQSLSVDRFGVWGNSFGGLFAAHLAVRDQRVRALCVNGSPMMPVVPTFRTAREQMEAVLGTSSEAVLTERVGALALDPGRHHTGAAMLVVQGGRDAMVPLGSQESFFALSSSGEKSTFTWRDGDHTIYNHAQERSNRIADWFAGRLCTDRS